MHTVERPFRSVLYLPGSSARALQKAREVAADALILDLEDAVAPTEKPAARDLLAATLHDTDYGARYRILRINGFDTEWGRKDALTFAGHPGVDAVLVPKVAGPAELDAVTALMPGKPLWAMLETAQGCLAAQAICAHPRLEGVVMGTNDLARDLGARVRADRLAMLPALGLCLLAARAAGRVIVDGVYNAFRDEAGLRAEAEQGRDLGFDGKSLIHPAQIGVANAVFAPASDDIDLARRQIDAFAAAQKEGRGVAVLDGRIVENLHIVTARQTLARAEAIAARQRKEA